PRRDIDQRLQMSGVVRSVLMPRYLFGTRCLDDETASPDDQIRAEDAGDRIKQRRSAAQIIQRTVVQMSHRRPAPISQDASFEIRPQLTDFGRTAKLARPNKPLLLIVLQVSRTQSMGEFLHLFHRRLAFSAAR